MIQRFFHDKKIKYIAFASFGVLFMILSLFLKVSPVFATVMILWCGLMLYALSDLKNRAAYAIFLVTFFLFLLGGEFFELYMGYPADYTFPEEVDLHAYISLLISLLFLHFSFAITEHFSFKKAEKPTGEPKQRKLFVQDVRQFAKIGLYVTTIPYFMTTIEACINTIKNGYLSYYTTFRTQLPGFIGLLSDLFLLFFFFFLATIPSKKECILPMLIYLLNGMAAIVTGRRLMFGIALLVLLFYIVIRHFMAPEENWLNKKKIIFGVLLCPLILIFFYVQYFLRYGLEIEGGNPFDIIFSFLARQGTSINMLKLPKIFNDDSLGCTSLYYTLHYLRGNFLTRDLFDFPMQYYMERTVNTALHTNCLADYIMYKVSPASFVAGHGLGTSYIAELYHDLGYAGIALGSAVYGFLLQWLYSLRRSSFFKLAIGLLILEQFTILPRYGADVIMRPFYNLSGLFILALLILYAFIGKQGIKQAFNKLKSKELKLCSRKSKK